MQTRLIIIAISLFFGSLLMGQAPDTMWIKTFGGLIEDHGRAVQQTSDGGYIIAGDTRSFGNDTSRVYLIRTDQNGNTLWTNTFNSHLASTGYAVVQTSDGGFVVSGGIAANNTDAYLLKANSNGQLLWTKSFGGFGLDFGASVQETNDGGLIITGEYQPTTSNFTDLYLIKTNSSGDTVWTKTYGGSSREIGNSVQQMDDGGYIITGETFSFGAGGSDLWLLRTDTNGDTLWTKTYGRPGNDKGRSVQQTSDNGFIIAGSIGKPTSLPAVWLLKTDANGDTLWTKSFGGNISEEGYSVYQTSDNGFIITGYTFSFGLGGTQDIYVIRTDQNGNLLWMNTFGGFGNDKGFSVQQTSDGGYIVVGDFIPIGSIYPDVMLIKIMPDVTAINEPSPSTINQYRLAQNYPNPFNPSTTIQYALPHASNVQVIIYDVLGRAFKTLVNKNMAAGTHTVQWNGTNDAGAQVSSGIYIYRLQGGEFRQTRKMILVR